jgi:hypothetical protein
MNESTIIVGFILLQVSSGARIYWLAWRSW